MQAFVSVQLIWIEDMLLKIWAEQEPAVIWETGSEIEICVLFGEDGIAGSRPRLSCELN